MSKTKKKPVKNKTVVSEEKQGKFEYYVTNAVCVILFILFAYITVISFIQTSVIDPAKYASEVILYQNDAVIINLLLTAAFIAFLFLTKRWYNFFAKINIKFMEIGLAAYVLILGFTWILSVMSVPAADSQNIFETATDAVNGKYSSLIDGQNFYNSDYYGGYSYYNYYPFQLGFVFICEIIYRLFGTASSMPLQVINVLCTAAAYLAIAKITALLFKKRSIEFMSIILLAGCFQPILFCTFAYGNVIGMCCALWSSYFLIKYFRTNKYTLLIPCGLLLITATLAKYNNMIYLVAFVIMLIIHTVKQKKWQSIAFALAICIAAAGASSLVIMSYESRAGVKLSDGVSQTLYLDMGLNESYMAPGWYNGISLQTYKNNALNSEAANRAALSDIKSRLDTMSKDPGYALEFFNKKIISQWNEPTFESIWVSKVKGHYKNINSLAESVYSGSFGQFFESYFNFYMQIIYLLFTTGIVCLVLNKKSNIETALLPLVLLGGFGYHLLFEGKSQYLLTYIVLLIPTAAYAIGCILDGKYTKIKTLLKK